MSRYLVDRIRGPANVEIITGCEIDTLEGTDEHLDFIAWYDLAPGRELRRPVTHLFSFIGVDPNTDWWAVTGPKVDERALHVMIAKRTGNATMLSSNRADA